MDTPAAESQYYLNKKVFSYVSQTNCKVLKSNTIKTNSLFSLVKKIFFCKYFFVANAKPHYLCGCV